MEVINSERVKLLKDPYAKDRVGWVAGGDEATHTVVGLSASPVGRSVFWDNIQPDNDRRAHPQVRVRKLPRAFLTAAGAKIARKGLWVKNKIHSTTKRQRQGRREGGGQHCKQTKPGEPLTSWKATPRRRQMGALVNDFGIAYHGGEILKIISARVNIEWLTSISAVNISKSVNCLFGLMEKLKRQVANFWIEIKNGQKELFTKRHCLLMHSRVQIAKWVLLKLKFRLSRLQAPRYGRQSHLHWWDSLLER